MQGKRLFFAGIFLIGLILGGFSVAGLFLPLEHPHIYTEPAAILDGPSTLTEAQFYAAIAERNVNVSDSASVAIVNRAVHQRIAHYWSEDDNAINKYGYRVPLHENYLLSLSSYLNPAVYRHYEYCDYRKAVERGVGVCSQHAMIATAILREQGIKASVIGLADLHVVATAQVDREHNTWWVIDPDYGVVIPHAIQEIQDDPHIVRPYYQEAGYSGTVVDQLVAWYGTEGIRINRICQASKERFERMSYIAIWVLPALLMLAGALPFLRDSRLSRSHAATSEEQP